MRPDAVLRLKNQQQMFLCCFLHGSRRNKPPQGKRPSGTLTGVQCASNVFKCP